MRGVRIDGYETPGSFAAVFAPILPDLRRFWWADSPLDDPRMADDEQYAAVWAALDHDMCIPPDTLLPRFAHYVKDFDWCYFCGFGSDPGPADAVYRRIEQAKQRPPGLPPDVEIVFQNMDGVCWCLFARDTALVEAVAAHAAERSGWSARRLVWGAPL
jgi:hypothetical protein